MNDPERNPLDTEVIAAEVEDLGDVLGESYANEPVTTGRQAEHRAPRLTRRLDRVIRPARPRRRLRINVSQVAVAGNADSGEPSGRRSADRTDPSDNAR
jgi:hypothetical protein